MISLITLLLACPQRQEIDICRVPIETEEARVHIETKDEYIEPQAECIEWRGGDCYNLGRPDSVRFE